MYESMPCAYEQDSEEFLLKKAALCTKQVLQTLFPDVDFQKLTEVPKAQWDKMLAGDKN